MIKHPKRRGEWVELQFMARAAAHGLTVSKPWGDMSRYDVVVDSGGRFFRVQVKSTECISWKGWKCQTANRGRYYSAADIDFVAAYIVPEDLWYVIPISVLGDHKDNVYLAPRGPRNKYSRYLEAWHLLGAAT